MLRAGGWIAARPRTFGRPATPALHGVVRFVLSTISRVNRSRRWAIGDSLGGMDLDVRPVDPDGGAFARAMGAGEALVEVRRRLHLTTADLDAPATPGYSVVYWPDIAPDDHLADLARLDRSLEADAPHGDLVVEVPEADGG